MVTQGFFRTKIMKKYLRMLSLTVYMHQNLKSLIFSPLETRLVTLGPSAPVIYARTTHNPRVLIPTQGNFNQTYSTSTTSDSNAVVLTSGPVGASQVCPPFSIPLSSHVHASTTGHVSQTLVLIHLSRLRLWEFRHLDDVCTST